MSPSTPSFLLRGGALVPPGRSLAKPHCVEWPGDGSAGVPGKPGALALRVLPRARLGPLLRRGPVARPQRLGAFALADDLERLAASAGQQPLGLPAQRAVGEHPVRPRLDPLAQDLARRIQEPEARVVARPREAMLPLQLAERPAGERVHLE